MANRCGLIALAGRPNAGKSTFLNQVLGEKVSIVSDKPQTTRNRILGIYHDEELQIGFLDLPGIHKPQHQMNRLMMKAVRNGLEDADLIFHFVDVSVPLGRGEKFVAEMMRQAEIPVVVVANKMDLVNKAKVIPMLAALQEQLQPTELVPISAKTGDNIQRLIELAKPFVPEAEFRFGSEELTDQPMRFMAQEFIREKILHFTREEIPHASAVSIEQYEDTEEGLTISAVIWIDSKNQRRILIGHQGSMISKIRTAAQRSLRKRFERPVQLELFVKVQGRWRDRDTMLGDLHIQ